MKLLIKCSLFLFAVLLVILIIVAIIIHALGGDLLSKMYSWPMYIFYFLFGTLGFVKLEGSLWFEKQYRKWLIEKFELSRWIIPPSQIFIICKKISGGWKNWGAIVITEKECGIVTIDNVDVDHYETGELKSITISKENILKLFFLPAKRKITRIEETITETDHTIMCDFPTPLL